MFGKRRDQQAIEVMRAQPVDERGESRWREHRSRASQLRDEPAQRQLVAVGAEAAQHGARAGRKHRVPPLGLARVDVRQVNLDVRNLGGGEGVADGETGVRVGAGVDQRTVGACRAARGWRRSARPPRCAGRTKRRRPALRQLARSRASISASVVVPYSAGSRVPSRLRFGPLSTAIFTSS